MEGISFGFFLTGFFCAVAIVALPVAAVIAQTIERHTKNSSSDQEGITTLLIFFLFMVLSCIGLAVWSSGF
jgi:hypothetical protein